ncbi:hypothetical protein GTO89_05855 [Heliobacterium gestii]|uniref:Uncharacterized protein n=1 Tax=Heliomicrobium gestii TaxID=2699 RepID=A0A845LCB6_HELGE|nr:hypothetical protein [Heliomicrobium gestii]MBM7866113.1 hypothetical protein [Heliomicrobium gestii]MZP42560.1 hypothetical protein [Heliomicrobium gestii]
MSGLRGAAKSERSRWSVRRAIDMQKNPRALARQRAAAERLANGPDSPDANMTT